MSAPLLWLLSPLRMAWLGGTDPGRSVGQLRVYRGKTRGTPWWGLMWKRALPKPILVEVPRGRWRLSLPVPRTS